MVNTPSKRRLAFLFSLISILLAASACSQSTPDQSAEPTSIQVPESEQSGVVKGFGISPQGFPLEYSRFGDFLEEVGSIPNGGVMYNGPWRDDVEGGSDAGELPSTAVSIMVQAEAYGFTPIIVFGWRSDDNNVHLSLPNNPTDDWSNEEAKALFEKMLVEFTSAYLPPYLFLGNESDGYFIGHADDYARWVDFYNRAYDAIKVVSPSTSVGPIFQYDRMSGQAVSNNWTTPQWGALEQHDLSRVDIVGITVYPWLGFSSPEDIPRDYLAPLLERIGNVPIAITETGWPGDSQGLELFWEASADAQVRYIASLTTMLAGVDIRMLNWPFLYPLARSDDNLQLWQTFGSLSLRDTNGEKRPVYDLWMAYQP